MGRDEQVKFYDFPPELVERVKELFPDADQARGVYHCLESGHEQIVHALCGDWGNRVRLIKATDVLEMLQGGKADALQARAQWMVDVDHLSDELAEFMQSHEPREVRVA